MTDIDLFNQLPLNNKLTLLKYKAILLQAYKEDDKTFAVYALNGYYVEMVSDNEKKSLNKVSAFTNQKKILKYVDSVSLKYLNRLV